MTALSADAVRDILQLAPPMRVGLKTATTVYDRSAVCLENADGFARPVAASLTSPEFLGFALEGKTNSGSSGTVDVLVCPVGLLHVALAAIAGAAGVGDIGSTVYMSDDGTGLTLTSTNNVAIGKIIAYSSITGLVTVKYEADAWRSI